jgi:hypothetical protein
LPLLKKMKKGNMEMPLKLQEPQDLFALLDRLLYF